MGGIYKITNRLDSKAYIGKTKDADFNAAQNILIRDTLWEIPFGFRNRRDNLKGFFWNPDGLYLDTGEVLTVPPCQN